MTHTPTPWETIDGAEITPSTGPTAHVELCRVVGPWDGSTWYDKATAKANAAFIVRAVNRDHVFDELVVAVKTLLREVEHLVEDGTLPADVVMKHPSILEARAALAKAEETK